VIRGYFYKLIRRYLALYIRPEDVVYEVDPSSGDLLKGFPNGKALQLNRKSPAGVKNSLKGKTASLDYLLLHGPVHYEHDIQSYFDEVRKLCNEKTRLIVTYYSSLWKPFIGFATLIRLRKKRPESNWLSHEDIDNLLLLSGFQKIRLDSKILIPINIPIISWFANRYLAPLPVFRYFTLVNIAIARPILSDRPKKRPSVSIVVAARNEEGNIDNIIRRIPKMGPADELIFVEGNSTDNTWAKILDSAKKSKKMKIVTAQQDGKGKGDAVRKGFSLAKKEILMILDADLTVPPEDLPKFYEAIVSGKGEFINGSRLVYPMEERAMRFLNMIGNKFFALAFSFILGQRFKDTLCGTKVLTRDNYERLARNRSYFGDFDPFGDFDLIFGAARMGLKIVEVPIVYRERVYGTTNISRWSHGLLLLRMVVFAARKFKFL